MRQAAIPLAPGDRYPPQLRVHNYSPQPVPRFMQQVHGNSASFTSSDSGGYGYRPPPTLAHLFDRPDPEELNRPQPPQVYRVIHPYGKIPTKAEANQKMTGNTFFNSGPGSTALAKSKSGTLPDRYTSPAQRGFRDTFVSSMTSSSPPAQPRSTGSSPYYPANRNSSPAKEASNNNPPVTNGNKKWSFGGLFKRKVKTGATNINGASPAQNRDSSPAPGRAGSLSHSSPSASRSSGNASRIDNVSTHPHYANPHVQQLNPGYGSQSPGHLPNHLRRERSSSSGPNGHKFTAPRKPSESEVTSDDSELEVQTPSSQVPTTFKQNFLTRRLSRRKEKAAAKKLAATNAAVSANSTPTHTGLLRVPLLNNGKRVGSSPDSLNNGNTPIANNIFAGNGSPWEITKKVPQLQPANNYSSSGSLSLSQEGSSKGSRAAAKEAVKARAVARRESFIQDSSSDEGEEDGRSRSSIQGSHSSLTPSRGGGNGNGVTGVGRRQRPYSSNIGNINQINNNPGQGQGQSQGQPFRPVVVVNGRGSAPSSPARFDRRNNNSASPQVLRKVVGQQPPGSPRWEARVVYTQENHENETPFIVKLPLNRGASLQPNRPPSAGPQASGYGNGSYHDPQQQVITAGLRVPISGSSGPGGQITEEVHYANLPGNKNHTRFRSATPLNYPVTASPPPPPPRREYSRLVPSNQNFYRPVSCSYLDSYQQQGYYPQQHPQHQMRVASPSPNLNYYGESHHPIPPPPQVDQGHNGNYYYPNSDQVDNARVSNNNNFLSPRHSSLIHPSLIRSPSEPPEIKVSSAARNSPPIRRNASTPTPTPNYYYNTEQPVISKLGFPVRKLNDPGKIPLAQSPVHMRASEFWRKKEAEVSGSPVGQNPNHVRYMNRIRSADSSPLPVHRIRASPGGGVGLQNSNESISSLSSFSAEAHGHSPHQRVGLGGRKIGNSAGQPNEYRQYPGGAPLLHGYNATATVSSNTNGGHSHNHCQTPRQESRLSKSDREQTPQNQTACERLKVRNPSAPEGMVQESNKVVRSLVELNNGKTPGRNLEDALNELEVMYKSLRLSDEDLLDRAERRDLPTPHQELRHAPPIPLPAGYQNNPQVFRYNNEPHYGNGAGSVESLATGSSRASTSTSGSGGSANYSNNSVSTPDRVRAPPLRRSARPDTVSDDMARRRFEPDSKPPLDPRDVVSQTGSYMVLSPAFSPPVSPCPPETLPASFTHSSSLLYNQDEPDLTLDDVSFRHYKQANSIRIIDPQPKFGIPLGPITTGSETDYLHSKRSDRLRPLFKAVKNPDLVNDDIAFRALRKDLNTENNLSNKDWTPRLFSPSRDNTFTYNSVSSPEDHNRKLRSIRSLSANITSYTPFMSEYDQEVGKWNSFTDLHHVQRGSSHWRPSWVEQVEKVNVCRGGRGILLGGGRRSNNKFFPNEPQEFHDEEQYFERKVPSKTVELTPDLYDPTRSRRPWTDIILESFEKDRQEREEAAAAAAAAGDANVVVNPEAVNDSGIMGSMGDDDVFLDARDKSKSTSPEKPNKNGVQQSQPKTKILANYSDFKTTANPGGSGQYNRRGSWVEPVGSRYGYNNQELMMGQDLRRRSWSGLPPQNEVKFDLDLFSNKVLSPRKIKQINLDQFNSSDSVPPMNEINYEEKEEFRHQQIQDGIPGESSPAGGRPNRSNAGKKGEAELNALMDMLIREADSCGSEVRKASLSEKESGLRTEFESNTQRRQPMTPDFYTTSDRERMVLPTNGKESGIDEPTKKTETDTAPKKSQIDNTMSKQRAAVLKKSSLEEPPPEIVAVSRKHPLPAPDFFELDDDICTTKSNKTVNSSNYGVCSTSHENEAFISSTTTTTITVPTTSTTPPQRHCSIEELIDSINESLPELEPHPGPSSSTKSAGSSLSSTGSGGGRISPSPPGSIPSPRSSSPVTVTTITLTHRPRPVLSSECSSVEEYPVGQDKSSPNNNSNIDETPVLLPRRASTTSNSSSSGSEKAGPSQRKSKEEELNGESSPRTNELRKSHQETDDTANPDGESFLLAQSTRSQSQLGESVSSSVSGQGCEPEAERDLDENLRKLEQSPNWRKSRLTQTSTPVFSHSSSFHPHPTTNSEIKTEPEISLCQKKSSTPIYKVPRIPSILTTNNHKPPSPSFGERAFGRGSNPKSKSNTRNGMSKSPDNSISARQPSSPSLKPNILNKVGTFQGPARDPGFSEAEGVSFIKKLLAKESLMEVKQNEVQSRPFVLKKSPSAGSTWSKFANGQPIFFKKFFERSSHSDDQNSASEIKNDQLAADQGNENGCETTNFANIPVDTSPSLDEEPPKSYSVAQKASFFMKLEHDQRFSKWRENSLDATSNPCPSPLLNKINPQNSGADISPRSEQPKELQFATNPNDTICSGEQDSQPGEHNLDPNFGLDPEEDIPNPSIPSISQEPSKLSLKDRVYMFDKLIAVGGKPPTPLPSTITGFPVLHSSSAVIPSHRGLSKVIQGTTPGCRQSAFFPRRGSTSDIELNLNPVKLSPVMTPARRSSKTRSLYVNNDELSEDGEVSSGGQEVSDIISRSYENTPIARKKSLKNAKQPQLTFTKEIWRRCRVNDKNNVGSNFLQPSYKATTNVTQSIVTTPPKPVQISAEISQTHPKGVQEQSESSPPATSNLLQFLSEHGSESSQELTQFARNQIGFGPTSDGNNLNLNSSRVHIPYPDDESFQLFFGSGSEIRSGDRVGINLSSCDQQSDTEMNAVLRESDLLVMKKNVPLVRRKSRGEGKGCRNPLRALAARIDFRNQYYTQQAGSEVISGEDKGED